MARLRSTSRSWTDAWPDRDESDAASRNPHDVCRREGDPRTIGTRAATLTLWTPSLAALEVWRAPLCGRGHAFPEIRRPALPLLLDEFTFGCGLDLLDQTAA
jgi:hypothetical protein